MDSMTYDQPASLDIIIGPMFSNKTVSLVRKLNIFAEMDLKVVYINSKLDTRSSADFSTHNPMLSSLGKIDSYKVKNLGEILEKLSEYDVIGIDEATLFSDLKKVVLTLVEEKKKRVIVAGLNGTYKREPFGEILDLIPYADNVTKLSAFCKCCKDGLRLAHFSKLISKKRGKIIIGGGSDYVPVCRECFKN